MVSAPEVVDALNACLRAERTLHEGLRDHQHVFNRHGNEQFAYFCKEQYDCSRQRADNLICRILELDELPNQQSDVYPIVTSPLEAINNLIDAFEQELRGYSQAVDAAEAAGDRGTECCLYHLIKAVSCALACAETKRYQIEGTTIPVTPSQSEPQPETEEQQ
jgi:bacterioferritin (cytochrome b1)